MQEKENSGEQNNNQMDSNADKSTLSKRAWEPTHPEP